MSYRISQLIKIFLRWPILSIWHSLEEGIWVAELLLSVSPVVIFSIVNWYKMSQPKRLHHHWIILWNVQQKNFRRQRVWRTRGGHRPLNLLNRVLVSLQRLKEGACRCLHQSAYVFFDLSLVFWWDSWMCE